MFVYWGFCKLRFVVEGSSPFLLDHNFYQYLPKVVCSVGDMESRENVLKESPFMISGSDLLFCHKGRLILTAQEFRLECDDKTWTQRINLNTVRQIEVGDDYIKFDELPKLYVDEPEVWLEVLGERLGSLIAPRKVKPFIFKIL